MIILIVMLGVLATGVVLAVVVSRSAVPGVQEPVNTQSFAGLPVGPVYAADLQRVKLDLAFRGYRMDQVDALMKRLTEEIAIRDGEIDRLRQEQEHHGDL